MRLKIIGTGPVDQVALDILEPFGEITIAPDLSEVSLISLLNGAAGLIVRGGGVASAKVINAAAELRVIGRSGAGYETVDIIAATARKIPVVYAPGAGSRAVAEAAITFMLALCKNLYYWNQQCKLGNWLSRYQSKPGDLEGATVGIIGFGRVGQSLAQLLQPFHATVLAYDPYVSPDRSMDLGVEQTTFEDLLTRSDFLTLHSPLNAQTRGMINRQTLLKVKPGAYLINLARGGLIESLDVLLEFLDNGILAGVGLDVFDPEPPDKSHAIFEHPNCLTSPHALATTHRAMFQIFKSMAEDMAAVLCGTRPRFVVNPEVFD